MPIGSKIARNSKKRPQGHDIGVVRMKDGRRNPKKVINVGVRNWDYYEHEALSNVIVDSLYPAVKQVELTKAAVRLEHHAKPVDYVDVSMPTGALDYCLRKCRIVYTRCIG